MVFLTWNFFFVCVVLFLSFVGFVRRGGIFQLLHIGSESNLHCPDRKNAKYGSSGAVNVDECWDLLSSHGSAIIQVNEFNKWDQVPCWAKNAWDRGNCLNVLGIFNSTEITEGGTLPPFVEVPVLSHRELNTLARLLQVFLERAKEKNIP